TGGPLRRATMTHPDEDRHPQWQEAAEWERPEAGEELEVAMYRQVYSSIRRAELPEVPTGFALRMERLALARAGPPPTRAGEGGAGAGTGGAPPDRGGRRVGRPLGPGPAAGAAADHGRALCPAAPAPLEPFDDGGAMAAGGGLGGGAADRDDARSPAGRRRNL